MSQSNSDKRFPRRRHVALIVETSLASGRAILQGVAQYVREGAAWSVYHEPRGLEGDLPRWLGDWEGDGIIVRAQNRSIAEGVLRTGLPAVDVLGVADDPRLPLVHVDNRAIARIAADHFLERGFKHFGYCGIEGVNWSQERGSAFERAVNERMYKCEHFLLPGSGEEESWEQEQDRLGEWLRALTKPVAVMACNDPRGQRVLEACRRAQVLVPDEVAVIGVDNDEVLCEIASPSLSSIVPGHNWVGYHAAALLTEMMSGASPKKMATYVSPIGCVTRLSSDALAIGDADVVQAMAFIREHACDRIAVQDVVDHVSISRSALKRRFTKYLGRGVYDEIMRVRMERARWLLGETEMPIDRVARTIGYEHAEYFSVAFRRETGETPAVFRRRAQSRQSPVATLRN